MAAPASPEPTRPDTGAAASRRSNRSVPKTTATGEPARARHKDATATARSKRGPDPGRPRGAADDEDRDARASRSRSRHRRGNSRSGLGSQAAELLRKGVITALAYAAVGLAAMVLAGPPGYAAPLYPSAGIALAAVLAWGRAALPGVWLGSVIVNAYLGWQLQQDGWLALAVLPLMLGLGSALQAAAGAWLLRRYLRSPLALDAPREIALAALLGAGAACLISASVAVPSLAAAGTLRGAELLPTWVTWYLGDALGVLIATPIVLTLIGQPQTDWRARRLTIGLPMLVAMLMTGAAMLELEQRAQQNLRASFERDVDRLASDAQSRLQVPLYALQAMHGVARTQAQLDSQTLNAAASWWLAMPGQLQAIGYGVRVPRLDIERYEFSVRANGLPDYRVIQRDNGSALGRDDEVLAIRLVEPVAGNESSLGVNLLSIPATREAILKARRTGQPAATSGFQLTPTAATAPGTPAPVSVAVYQALYDGEPGSDPERNVAFRGLIFVTLRAEALLQGLAGAEQTDLAWCVVDPAPAAGSARIAGPVGCEARTLPPWNYRTVRLLELGGRAFELRVDIAPGQLPRQPSDGHTLLSLAAMAAVAMLGALLLIVTGHSRRTEMAVRSGTADLRREVSERAQTQQALADSEERLRSILNHLPIGVMFLDDRGRMLECNPRLCDMLGETLEQLRGMTLLDLMHPQDRRQRQNTPGALAPVDTAASQEQQPVRLQRSDGQAIWVQVSTTPLREGTDAPGRRVGVVQDVTEHLRLRDSERALEAAEASSRAKSEFVSRMSHELRTPLNAMIGFAQLMGLDREPGLTSRQKEWAQQIQRAGWHLLEMINETLDLARIESGAVHLASQPVLLSSLVHNARAMVSAAAAQRDIVIEESLAADSPAVMADETRLKQVLTNLLSNAVKYNVDKGRVWVSARAGAEGCVVIAVTDTGLGMTPEQLADLFQPYNRLGRETSGIEGTGIGLVISRRLVELMGGTLAARSVAGKGSTFTLRLPAATPQATQEAPVPASPSAPYQRRRVHYVEDNPTNVEVMRGMLLQRPQVQLDISTNGLDALQNIRQRRPDLILLDMHLPDISGLELLRRLKDEPELALIPVVVVSADATPAKLTEALTLGASNYVSKPVDVGRFLTLLDETLAALDTRWGA